MLLPAMAHEKHDAKGEAAAGEPPTAGGQAAAKAPSVTSSQMDGSGAQEYFTDVVLMNQDGQPMRFYSDLLKDKVVVAHSFFGDCEGSCPVVMGALAKLQRWLGERLGKEVHVLSMTLNPTKDDPDKLKAYAQRLKAKPGWFFLSGKKENVNWALYKLGYYVEQRETHKNVVVVGNVATGL